MTVKQFHLEDTPTFGSGDCSPREHISILEIERGNTRKKKFKTINTIIQ